MVDTACEARSVQSDSPGEAGERPALPRNCELSVTRRSSSQATGRIDGAVRTFAGEGGFRSFLSDYCRRPTGRVDCLSLLAASIPIRSLGRSDLEDESKSHPLDDSTEPRPRRCRSRRHVASFAASIAAHAIVVGLIVFFALPLARGHSEWVLAYLVDGASGPQRGGASAAAAMHAASAAPAAVPIAAPPPAARKPRRRRAAAASEVSRLAPVHAVAQARPRAPAHDAPSASHSDADGSCSAAVSGNGGSSVAAGAGAGTASSGFAAGAAGGDGDPNSIAHADYANNPPPAYPALARRREQQGTVTVRVLVGADGSVERAEVADSSGFDALDEAALETVRSRWRFVPARHGGLAVESWVLVPIRFALVEANAVH